MTYDVVSADGHEITGEVQFQVGAGAEPGVDEASAPTSAEAGTDAGPCHAPEAVRTPA